MDPNRVYAGFSVLAGGMNGGVAPSLITDDQVAASKDFTFRDGYVKTRPPFANLQLSFSDDTTEANWSGKFQGAIGYDSEFGTDGFIVARGGRLFRVELGIDNVINEITPRITIVTLADFTVPAVNAQVIVSVNSETIIATGDHVFIDSGEYLVVNRATQSLTLKYLGSAANAVALSGTAVLNVDSGFLIEYQTNPASYDLIYAFNAENYVIILAGQHKTIIYDGTTARQAAVDEIPPSVVGVYVQGRIWVTLPDRRTFIAGDIVFGPSGTPENGYRDAILKFTENDFLNEGGSFGVPRNAGPITGMIALATQDTSLGIGALLIGTKNMVFSVNLPTDRTTWKNLTYPAQTVCLIDYGGVGPRFNTSVNGDWWYRSLDGIRSFIVARREIESWGNTPMSREISPVLEKDTEALLVYGSATFFDNKYFCTVSPLQVANGVIHKGMVVINYDMLSSMRQKLPPSWEGVYTGLDILQVLKTTIGEKERAFAFVLHANQIELWEILKTGYYDEYNHVISDETLITRTAIEPWLETKSYDFQSGVRLKALYTAELYLDELVDDVTITIKFRPDQSPTWVTWNTINLCANVSQCTLDTVTCAVFKNRANQYAARIMLTKPPEDCNTISGMPVCLGYEFQFRIECSGHVRIRKFAPHAKLRPEPMEGSCPETPTCKTVEYCGQSYFTYDSHG